MLVDVKLLEHSKTELGKELGYEDPKRIQKGLYLSGMMNFEFDFRDSNDVSHEKRFPEISDGDWFGSFGVCDTPEQLMERLPKVVTEGPRKFVISVTPILKEDQPEHNGWRWHKWGTYIGDKNPTHEYLADEPDIERVYVFTIYEV